MNKIIFNILKKNNIDIAEDLYHYGTIIASFKQLFSYFYIFPYVNILAVSTFQTILYAYLYRQQFL